jgi:hypothetical protein
MKFISFLASTMLIVLISQCSIMGLPVNTTETNETCSEGFEMIKGQCMPIDSMTTDAEIETSSVPVEDVTVHEDKPVTELNPLQKSGACPEGMHHGKHGICEEITPSETTEMTVESSSNINESVGGVENIKGCPEGTEPDEQGACQEIKPSKAIKITSDPKRLLKKDGSCPESYKMIEGRCLYIKPKTSATLYPSGSTSDELAPMIRRPYNGNEESSKVELVPVLSDNSCPEGTEYSEYGLCQKRLRPINSNLRIKSDGSCPDGYELINGKCSSKDSKVQTQRRFSTTTTMSMSDSTTLAEEDLKTDQSFKSTTVGQSNDELHSEPEATASPL